MNTTSESNACQLRPEGELTIYTAADFKARLMEMLAKCQAMEIDLSQVGEMDTAGLQLLILAKRESQARNLDLDIVRHGAAVVEVLDLCNMTAFFGDPVVIPSEAH